MRPIPSVRPILNASLMCADALNLGEEVELLQRGGIDMFHLDVMDGAFVPNVTLGLDQVRAISGIAQVPVEVHLMVNNPDLFIEPLVDSGVDVINIHAETGPNLHRLLSTLAQSPAAVGLSVNPGTAIESVRDVLDLVDVFQVMTVDPGFAGQAFVSNGLDRVARAREALSRWGRPGTVLQVDGNIGPHVIPEVAAAGADSFVLGTSALFNGERDYQRSLDAVRELTGLVRS